MRLCTIAVYLTSLVLLTAGVPHRRIVGGQDAVGGFPWMASLLARVDGGYIHKCAAVLIAPHYLLTAAHCLRVKLARACLGGVDRTKTSQFECHDIAATIQHPLFDSVTYLNDIAVVKLSGQSLLQPLGGRVLDITRQAHQALLHMGIMYQCPPESLTAVNSEVGLERAGTAAQIYGWGVTNQTTDTLSSHLQTVNVTWMSLAACAEHPSPFERPISRKRMCTVPNPGHGPCVGDSGGPAIAKDSAGRVVLLGIASVGTARCAWQRPSLYVRARLYVKWIQKVTGGGPVNNRAHVPSITSSGTYTASPTVETAYTQAAVTRSTASSTHTASPTVGNAYTQAAVTRNTASSTHIASHTVGTTYTQAAVASNTVISEPISGNSTATPQNV